MYKKKHMATVYRAPGKRVVGDTVRHLVEAGARDLFHQQTQDYVPPTTTNLALWIDTGNLGGAAPRDGGDTVMGGTTPRRDAVGMPRADIALPGRPADAAITGEVYGVSAFHVPGGGGAGLRLGLHGGRRTLNAGAAFPGIQGTWGPFGAAGSWTIALFVALEQCETGYPLSFTSL
jgi:hypothetical protein